MRSDMEAQESALAVMDKARALFGEARFGSGWLEKKAGRTWIHVCAVDPTQGEVEALLEAADGAGCVVVVVPVARSYDELLSLHEAVHSIDIPEGTVGGYDVDARHNAIMFHLRRADPGAMDIIRRALPADAVRFMIDRTRGVALAMGEGARMQLDASLGIAVGDPIARGDVPDETDRPATG